MDFSQVAKPMPSKIYYSQILPSRSVTASSFSSGNIYVSDDSRGGIAHRDVDGSYFRFRANLFKVVGGAATQLTRSDGVSINMNAISCAFQSVSVDIAGTTLEQVDNWLAQLDTYQKRTKCTSSMLNSVKASTSFMQAKFSERLQYSVSDGVSDFFVNDSGLVVFDSTGTALQQTSLPAQPYSTKTFEFIYMPDALGITHTGKILPPSVPMRWTFNPYPSTVYPLRCIESITAKTVGKVGGPDGIVFEITDMQYYVKNLELNRVSDEVLDLTLECVSLQPTNLASTTSANNTYTCPESTYALSLAYQSTNAGTDGTQSVTKFKVNQVITPKAVTSDELLLNRWSVRYGAVSLPMAAPDQHFSQSPPASLADQKTLVTQGYFEHLSAHDLQGSNAGETLEDWILRGPVYSYQFPFGGSRSSNVTVQSFFNSTITNATELLIVKYLKRVSIVIENDRVTSVNVY